MSALVPVSPVKQRSIGAAITGWRRSSSGRTGRGRPSGIGPSPGHTSSAGTRTGAATNHGWMPTPAGTGHSATLTTSISRSRRVGGQGEPLLRPHVVAVDLDLDRQRRLGRPGGDDVPRPLVGEAVDRRAVRPVDRHGDRVAIELDDTAGIRLAHGSIG